MKYIYNTITIIALLFMNQSIIAQVDSGVIEYKKKFISKNFTKENNKNLSENKLRKFAKIENEIKNAHTNISFSLFFTKDESLFKINPIIDNTDYNVNKLAVGPEGSGTFYNSKNLVLRQLNTYGEDFIISKNQYKWTLKNETKKIGDYLCYKAITVEEIETRNGIKNYETIAWYCPKINVSFGPLGFSNLPGLILELDSRNVKYYATVINLNPKTKVEIKKPSKGKKITKEEYNSLGVRMMNDFKKNKGY